MARKQYTWHGEALWMSQSGNAALALVNPLGSGKKLLVHRFDVHPLVRGGPGAATGTVIMRMCRASVDGGWPVLLSPRDTNAGAIPSGIEVRKFAASDEGSRTTLWRRYWPRSFTGNTALGITQAQLPCFAVGKNRDGWNGFEINLADANVEALRLRPSEAITFVTDSAGFSQFLGVSGTLVVEGSPNRTYDFNTISWANAQGTDIISVVNNHASAVVRIKRINLREIGNSSTPYFQLVPVGAVDPQSQDDVIQRLTCTPTDSAYGALSASHAKLIADAPLKPFGVPEAYASEGGAGAPKQMNYLHTKDFIGPLYATFFPEISGCASVGVAYDTMLVPHSTRGTGLLSPRAPIVIREGEGLALVSAAETAGNPTWASGWAHFDFGIQFSVEPTVIPSITVTGIVSGSDVVILDAGTSDVLTQVDQNSGSTFAWEYDADLVDTVDICVYKAGYIPYILRNIDPGNAGITLPVAQVADRNYVA